MDKTSLFFKIDVHLNERDGKSIGVIIASAVGCILLVLQHLSAFIYSTFRIVKISCFSASYFQCFLLNCIVDHHH